MDKDHTGQAWVGNIYRTFEAVCQEVDDFVNNDAVESMKKFYSGVVQDILPPLLDPVKHVAQVVPSKQINLLGTYARSIIGIEGNAIGIGTNESSVEGGPFDPKKCDAPSSASPCDPKQIKCVSGGVPVGEAQSDLAFQQEREDLINEPLRNAVHVHLNSDLCTREVVTEEQSSCERVVSPEYRNAPTSFMDDRRIDEKYDDARAKISHESIKDHLGRSLEEEGSLYKISESDALLFENADWGIESIMDINLSIEEKIIEEESSPSEDVNGPGRRISFTEPAVEKNNSGSFDNVPAKTLVNCLGINESQEGRTVHDMSVDEFERDSTTSSILRSFELENSVVYCENKEEALHASSSSFRPAKACDLSSSSLANSFEKPETLCSYPTDSMGCFSVSSHGLSSSESFPAIGSDDCGATSRQVFSCCDLSLDSDDAIRADEAVSGTESSRSMHHQCHKFAQSEASVSFSLSGAENGSTTDIEDLEMESIDLSDEKELNKNGDLVKDEQHYAFSCRSKRRSYKKIIQDAFASRKRLTKEYKQLPIWHADIDREFSQLRDDKALPNIGTTSWVLKKLPAQDLSDSEWELL